MLVYHGSKEKFTQFDYDKIGLNGTSEGKGFYFTDNKEIAERYASGGHLYTVDFKGVKSLSSEKFTLTKTQVKKYMLKLHKLVGYLDNWGDVEYEGVEGVLRMAVTSQFNYNDNDVDLICSICNESGDIEICLKLLYKMLGYDSIVMEAEWGNQKLYIALVPDIINIVKVENRFT